MKRVNFTEKQWVQDQNQNNMGIKRFPDKDFLKKVGIAAGIAIMGGGIFYALNRSEIGCRLKKEVISAIKHSIIIKNNRPFIIDVSASARIFTEEQIREAVNAAENVLKPILEEFESTNK